MIARSFRTQLFLFTILAGLFAARNASAQTACINDVDCPNAACGGDICDWVANPAMPTCKAAGSQPKGQDGWCTSSADCKCMGMGATCAIANCTFTRPCEADGGTCAAGGSSGGTGTAGTSGGGGGGGGCSVAAGESAGGWSALLVALGLVGLHARRRR